MDDLDDLKVSPPEMGSPKCTFFFFGSEQQPKRVGSLPVLKFSWLFETCFLAESEDRKVSKSRRVTNGRVSVWQDPGDFFPKMIFIPI